MPAAPTMSWHRWLQYMSAVWVGALLAAATVWVLGRIRHTLWLLAAGLLVAYLLDPLLDRLEKRGWSRLRAVVTVTAALAVALGLLLAWLVPALVAQAQHLAAKWPDYSAAIDRAYQNAHGWLQQYVDAHFPQRDVMPFVDAKVEQAREWLAAKLPSFLRVLTDTLVRSVSFIGVLVLLGIISFHFMLVIDPLRKTVRELLPARASEDVSHISQRVGQMLGQYVRGQLTVMLLAGVLATILMLGVGLVYQSQYALVIGLINGLLYALPWVGPGLSMIAAATFTYVSAGRSPLWAAVAAMVVVVVVNQICDQWLAPKIIGRRVGVHPLVVIFAFLVGYQMLGFVGMVIAAPAAASIKIMLARWLPLHEVEVPPGKAPPLWLDMRAALRMGWQAVGRLRRRVEGAAGLARDERATSTAGPVAGTSGDERATGQDR